METIDVPLEDLPDNAIAWAWSHNLGTAKEGELPRMASRAEYAELCNVKMDAHPDEGGHFIFKDDLPFVALLRGQNGWKAYLLDEAEYPHTHDGSDLPLYEEILHLAQTTTAERDEDTCFTIIGIDVYLIRALLKMLSFVSTDDEPARRALRGRILRAKFAAVKIWQEGKLRKKAKS